VIRERTGFEAETVPGRTGQFDVLADGDLIFSKADTGRFPEEDEVLRLLPG
jgi:selT/selW/selH-like putative selenoprotein